MFRNSILGAFVALAVVLMVYPGCSSSGDEGGGEGAQALSFDGETSVPATGGAVIAVDYGTGFARVLSSMFNALAIDAASESASPSPKLLVDESLPICTSGTGTAVLNGQLGAGEVVSLTLTNCEGSPLSGTPTNGKIEITIDDYEVNPVAGEPTNFVYSLRGPAVLAGLTDASSFTISPDTVLTGGALLHADLSVSITPAAGIQTTAVALTLGEKASTDRITVVEGAPARTLEFACFEVVTDILVAPPSIEGLSTHGVLSLEGEVYEVVGRDIGFGALSGGPAVPTSGNLILTSGESFPCFGVPAGGESSATAEFEVVDAQTVVVIESSGADGETFRCTEDWENLLNTLSDLAEFESCPCVAGCGGGGDGDVIECAADALLAFNAYLDPLIEVLKAVEDKGYEIPAEKGIELDWATGDVDYGTFATDLDLNLDGKPESHLSGTVRPKDVCSRGMEKDDVCIFKWDVTREPSSTEVAYGATSAVSLGVSPLPPVTTATRYTIISYGEPDVGKVNIAIGISPDCAAEFDTFAMMWHLRIDDMYSLQMGLDAEFRDDAGWNTARGDVIWASGGSEDATISFTTDSETLQCGFEVETFEVLACEP